MLYHWIARVLSWNALGIAATMFAGLLALPSINRWADANILGVVRVLLGLAVLYVLARLAIRAAAEARRRHALDRVGFKRLENELVRARIHDLVLSQMQALGQRFYGLRFNSNTTVYDVIVASNAAQGYSSRRSTEIEVLEARQRAFDRKYGSDRAEDEKIAGNSIFGSWEVPFEAYCVEQNIDIDGGRDVLEVGVGTGQIWEGSALYRRLFDSRRSHYFTDISGAALQLARRRLHSTDPASKRNRFIRVDAERISTRIPPGCVDTYVSFRTFSSSLFDTRQAIAEASRVLRPGGDLIVTVPQLYIFDGDAQWGLMKDVTDKRPTPGYCAEVVARIVEQLWMWGFEEVRHSLVVDSAMTPRAASDSPYEVFVSARRSSTV